MAHNLNVTFGRNTEEKDVLVLFLTEGPDHLLTLEVESYIWVDGVLFFQNRDGTYSYEVSETVGTITYTFEVINETQCFQVVARDQATSRVQHVFQQLNPWVWHPTINRDQHPWDSVLETRAVPEWEGVLSSVKGRRSTRTPSKKLDGFCP